MSKSLFRFCLWLGQGVMFLLLTLFIPYGFLEVEIASAGRALTADHTRRTGRSRELRSLAGRRYNRGSLLTVYYCWLHTCLLRIQYVYSWVWFDKSFFISTWH